jgi:hypothetical protein
MFIPDFVKIRQLAQTSCAFSLSLSLSHTHTRTRTRTRTRARARAREFYKETFLLLTREAGNEVAKRQT